MPVRMMAKGEMGKMWKEMLVKQPVKVENSVSHLHSLRIIATIMVQKETGTYLCLQEYQNVFTCMWL